MTDPIKPVNVQAPTSTKTLPSTTPIQPASPTVALTPTVDEIMKVCPDTDKNNVIKYWPIIAKQMVASNMYSVNQVIAVIATIYVETGTFAPNKEEGRSFRYDPFRGRGFVQLTWRDDYLAGGKAIGLGDQLVKNPDMAMEPEIAAKLLCWEWKRGYNVSQYAERKDWANCRSIINAGHPGKIGITTQPGTRQFLEACKKAETIFKNGIDPHISGVLPGNYGLGCADPGSGTNRVINNLNPNTQLDALSYALGIQSLDNQRSHTLRFQADVAGQPNILDLDAQLTFEAKGFGTDLDGTFTVEEVRFYCGRTLEAEIVAYRPDPNAPSPSMFLHDANNTVASTQQLSTAANAPTSSDGSIPARIYAAAVSNRGKSTADGPDGGRNACAFSVNKFCIVPSGLKMLGTAVSPWGVPVAVDACEQALKGGRGQLIPRESALPGDVWLQPGHHIGICSAAGCAKVLSNSSSRASFQWEDTIDKVNSFYGGAKEHIYRVLN